MLDGENIGLCGIYVHDCANVTIRNGIVKGCYNGIRGERVTNLRIEHCVLSDNHNPLGVGWLDDTDEPAEEGFGGGIYLRQVRSSLILGNEINNNFNGIDLIGSEWNTLSENNVSYSGNIGVHLLLSSHNTIERNRADHCIRYTGRFWCDTADSAGILLEEYSHHNRIVDNTMRYSGDGLFIRANNRHGCNHNYIARNDGSFSPNNAFEAGFSKRNLFEDNIAEFSNYGFWLGYSRHTVARGNRVSWNRLDGIAIQHGSDNTIENNRITANRSGIRLWATATHSIKDPSERYLIRKNQVSNSRECGVSYSNTRDVSLEDNAFENNVVDVMADRLESRDIGSTGDRS